MRATRQQPRRRRRHGAGRTGATEQVSLARAESTGAALDAVAARERMNAMTTFLHDLRHAVRVLRAQPALTVVAVLSLALGIAPNTAVFSLIDAVGFRPLPIADPGRLVGIYTSHGDDPHGSTSFPDYLDVRDRVGAFASVAAAVDNAVGVSGDRRAPAVVMASSVSGSYFQTLGLRAALGRLLGPADDEGTGAPVAVVSDTLWARLYDRDPRIVGRVVRINHADCTIVGVAPPGFAGTTPVLAPEIWTPMSLRAALVPGRPASTAEARDVRAYAVFARLREGRTIGQAREEVASLGRHLDRAYPATNRGRALTADFEQAVRRRIPAAAGSAALAVIGLVLVTACANVAGLLLGRGEARRAEIAVRQALGAGRRRIVSQLMAEGLVLAMAGAAAAILVAFWLVRLIPSLVPALPITVIVDLRLDLRVLAFTLLAALAAVPLFALTPALVASRPDLTPVLKGEPVGAGRLRWLTMRHALVVGQIAVSLMLLVSSVLLVRGLLASRAVDPGFERRPMLFSTMAPPIVGYTEAETRQFYARLLERLEATPGVERAALARHVPLNALYGGGGTLAIEVPGHEAPPDRNGLRVRHNIVSAGFLDAMGTRLVRGRDFTAADREGAGLVALVNQRMATDFWRGADPLGQSFRLVGEHGERRDLVVVGVVQDAKYNRLNEPLEPYVYLPYAQHHRGEMTVLVRTRGDERTMIAPFRRAVEALDAAMPALQVVTMGEHLKMALFAERVSAAGAAALGGLGLFLSVIGLHGVVAWLVARKTREIGIRMALGADAAAVRAHVLGQGGRLLAAGVALGLALALAATRLIAGAVHGVSAFDPLSFGVGVAVVAVVALSAIWIPARRASRLDPLTALRRP